MSCLHSRVGGNVVALLGVHTDADFRGDQHGTCQQLEKDRYRKPYLRYHSIINLRKIERNNMAILLKKPSKADMTEGPFLKKIILFAIPVMLTTFIQQFYHTVDQAVVNHFGVRGGLAAIGSVGSLSSLITGLFMGLSVGAGVVAAQRIGAKKQEEITKVIHTSALLAAILGGLISVLGVLLSRSLLVWTGVPAEVLDQSTLYLQIHFLGTVGHMAGDSQRPLSFLLISGAVKVLMSILFVGAFRFGVAGVSLATALSYYLSAAMVLIYMARQKGILHFSLRQLKLDPASVKQILLIGVPSGIQSSLFSLSNVVIQSSVNFFGAAAIAGNAAGDTLGTYIYYCGHAVYQAVLTFVGQNVGAKRYDNVKRVTGLCLLVAVISQFVLGMLLLLLRSFFVGLLGVDDEAIRQVAFQRMLLELPLYWICGIMDVFSGALRGMGKSITNTVVSLVGACAFRVVWVNVIFHFVARNIGWVFISKPISWAIVGTVNGLFFLYYYRKRVKEQQIELTTTAE